MINIDKTINENVVCDYVFGPSYPTVYKCGLTEFQAEHYRDLMDFDWKHRITETEREV
jgi:hypothetical protein